MKHWQTKSLGEVAVFINGRVFKPNDWSSHGIPIIRIQNLTDPTAPANLFDGIVDKRYAVKNGDLLVSWSATLDVFIWNRGEAVLNQHIFRVDPDSSQIYKSYLFYALKSVMDELRSKTHGVTMQHITKVPFETTEIPLPTLAEQERIVSILDKAEEMKRLRTQANNRNADLIPAIFDEMFGNLAIDKLNWEVKPFEEIVLSTQLGLVRGSDEMGQDKEYPYLRMDSLIGDGRILMDDLKRVNANKEEVKIFSLEKGDFLFNTRNSRELVGKTGVYEADELVLFNNNIMRIRFNDIIDSQYVLWLFQTPEIKNELEQRKAGTTSVVAIYWKTLKTIPISIPPITLQKEFVARVEEIRALSTDQSIAGQKIESLFQSFLHRAFEGEL